MSDNVPTDPAAAATASSAATTASRAAVEPQAPELLAYRLVAPTADEDLWAAPPTRVWMEQSPNRFANRCLPLLIANQSGWLLINTDTVELTWNGGAATSDIEIAYPADVPPLPAISHFGMGIVTLNLPYFFRTSPGWNLLVRGPANCPKDGIYALDGVVEADWTAATFTMNWQLTRPGLPVVFERGEPLCMLVPQRRHDIENIRPAFRSLEAEPELERRVRGWATSREEFLVDLDADGSQARTRRWQKDYFQGHDVDGTPAAEVHQTKLRVREFVDER
ncbi:MAG TPA: DUF6065 family protein [Acidothermaceae bacterium]